MSNLKAARTYLVINDKLRLVRLDSLNLAIEMLCEVTSHKTGFKKLEWKTKGYYGDLKSAAGGVLKHCLMALSADEISSLTELIARVGELEKELKAAFKNEKENILFKEKRNMIEVEGFKAFRGAMRITPRISTMNPFEVYGDWLYMPDYDCWYANGDSYTASLCEVLEEEEWSTEFYPCGNK